MGIDLSVLSTEINEKDITRIKILPYGEYSAKDGRPEVADNFVLKDDNAKEIVNQINISKEDLLIDYEHLSLHADSNGVPGIAAGWFSTAEYVKGEGIYALGVKWTKKAKKLIKNLEFRYLSPVILSERKTGIIRAIKMVALVNRPALEGLEDLSSLSELAVNKFSTINKGDKVDATQHNKEFLESIGLSEDASLDQISDKIKKDQECAVKKALAAHSLSEKNEHEKGSTEIQAKVISDLSDKINALEKQLEQSQLSAIISNNKGKLSTPSLVEWAETLTVDQLNSFLKGAVDTSYLSQKQTTVMFKDKNDKEHALNEDELSVISSLGITKEQYLKSKGAS